MIKKTKSTERGSRSRNAKCAVSDGKKKEAALKKIQYNKKGNSQNVKQNARGIKTEICSAETTVMEDMRRTWKNTEINTIKDVSLQKPNSHLKKPVFTLYNNHGLQASSR